MTAVLAASRIRRAIWSRWGGTTPCRHVLRTPPPFAAAFGHRHLTGKLEVVADDACRKFHVDYAAVRLICTFAGSGTE